MIEIETLKKINNGSNEISLKIKEKEKLINECKENLSKLSKSKIEYRLYLYLLNGLSPTKAVAKVANENYINDISPFDPSSIWKRYKNLTKIISKQE